MGTVARGGGGGGGYFMETVFPYFSVWRCYQMDLNKYVVVFFSLFIFKLWPIREEGNILGLLYNAVCTVDT